MAGGDLSEEAVGFLDGKDERPGDHEAEEQSEHDRQGREAAHHQQRAAIRGGEAFPDALHALLLQRDDLPHQALDLPV